MANPEHLAILKQGVEQWNTWRDQNPKVLPDLRGAELSQAALRDVNFRVTALNGANLIEANFAEAHFFMANLSEARLCRANLSEANLGSADVCGVDLSEANLWMTVLAGADLRRAKLRRANLIWVNLDGATLNEADFTEATLRGTHFADVDLSTAVGLETVVHHGPSTIGIDTIYKSHGKIPEVFLRGCGLQDWEIELVKIYQPDLAAGDLSTVLYRVSELRLGAPVRYSSCFISYSTHDQEFADRLYADLQAKGVRCWFAPHDIQGGRKIHEQIDEAIRKYDKLLLILSEHSMASDWVDTEIADAREREAGEKKQLLFPISIAPFEDVKRWKLFDADRGKDSAREIREYFIPDFSNWKNHDSYQTAFQRLVGDLKAEASK